MYSGLYSSCYVKFFLPQMENFREFQTEKSLILKREIFPAGEQFWINFSVCFNHSKVLIGPRCDFIRLHQTFNFSWFCQHGEKKNREIKFELNFWKCNFAYCFKITENKRRFKELLNLHMIIFSSHLNKAIQPLTTVATYLQYKAVQS